LLNDDVLLDDQVDELLDENDRGDVAPLTLALSPR